uniref:Uncharacterized protein n=1 Tax=Ixodes ricinus TaxID=34613 RepID=A0A6B0URE9_IXORI
MAFEADDFCTQRRWTLWVGRSGSRERCDVAVTLTRRLLHDAAHAMFKKKLRPHLAHNSAQMILKCSFIMSKTIVVPYISTTLKKQRFSHVPHAFLTAVRTSKRSPLVTERRRSRLRYSAPKELYSALTWTI